MKRKRHRNYVFSSKSIHYTSYKVITQSSPLKTLAWNKSFDISHQILRIFVFSLLYCCTPSHIGKISFFRSVKKLIEIKFHITFWGYFLEIFPLMCPLCLRIFSGIFPLMYPLYPPLPLPPHPHFSRCCFWIRFHFTPKVAKSSCKKVIKSVSFVQAKVNIISEYLD